MPPKIATHCKNGHERTAENVDAKRGCRECVRAYHRKWRAEHRPQRKATVRKWKYGLTEPDYQAVLSEQGNKCAICKREFDETTKKTSPHVDHSHIDQAVRGILCDWCNKGLGNFEDSVEVLEAAVAYLKRQRGEDGTDSSRADHKSNDHESEGHSRIEEGTARSGVPGSDGP